MGEYAKGSHWYYAPDKATPIIFATLFFISACIHGFQNRRGWWKVMFALPWAALVHTGGMSTRAAGAFDYTSPELHLASSVLLISGPPIFAAANYIILGRLLYYIPYHAPLHPGRVLSTFIGLDAVIETITVNGAALAFNSDHSPGTLKKAGNLVKAGLILQLTTVVLFLITAGVFHSRCVKANVFPCKVAKMLYTVYGSSALILIRSIYGVKMVYEVFSDDHVGPAIKNEWVFWLFDGVAMLVNSYLLNIMHPSRLLPRDHKCYLAKDGITELMGPGWDDGRPLIVTIVDPFDVVGLLTGRDKRHAFWEHPESHGQGPDHVCGQEVQRKDGLGEPMTTQQSIP